MMIDANPEEDAIDCGREFVSGTVSTKELS